MITNVILGSDFILDSLASLEEASTKQSLQTCTTLRLRPIARQAPSERQQNKTVENQNLLQYTCGSALCVPPSQPSAAISSSVTRDPRTPLKKAHNIGEVFLRTGSWCMLYQNLGDSDLLVRLLNIWVQLWFLSTPKIVCARLGGKLSRAQLGTSS